MLMHEKLMAGQFFDLKTERKPLLLHQQPHHHHHHHHQQQQQHLQQQQQQQHHHLQQHQPHLQLPQNHLDLYAAYAYQQQLLGAALSQQQQQQQPASAEVLDLSRRCDSVETSRKTPSPYQTNFSYGSGSPSGSPSNLMYAGQQQQQQQQQQLSSLYPALYYGSTAGIKQEPQGSNSSTNATSITPKPNPTASLLQTFAAASAAAAAAAAARPASTASTMQIDILETPQSPPAATNQQTEIIAPLTTPTSSCSTESALKSTRPFKTFPRDPLVIAANFAATDVLLDNPRVERYTEYRKRVLEQIRSSNGGQRTVTNPKMRRTNSRSGSVNEGSSSNNNSESEDRDRVEESSDCDSHAGNMDKVMPSSASAKAAAGSSSTTTTTTSNSMMSISGSQVKDAAYYERRRKNNAAAKKSRDRRRIKEDEIAIRAAYLERQNIELLCQIDALKAQLAAFTHAKVATA